MDSSKHLSQAAGCAQHLTSHRNNDKAVNLSLSFRQTGLPSGAKLNLVVASKSPVPISVALQLPPSISSAAPAGRLTDKFPSNTTLWLILRKFEEGGGAANLNFTQRAVTQMENGASGAGRICYEMPVLNIMGRELSTFADLQKTLGQLGLSGNALIRLDFRKTDQPLEEAMAAIGEYFKDVTPEAPKQGSPETLKEVSTLTEAISKLPSNEESDDVSKDTEMTEASEDTSTDASPYPEIVGDTIRPSVAPPKRPAPATNSAPEAQSQVLGPDGQPISVYRAPSNDVPSAALAPHNEDDYEPSIAHAKIHQQTLLERSHNKRLPSDAEAEQLEKERLEKLAKTKEVKIKIRFPDQSSVEASFDATKTGSDLYVYVTGLIAAEAEPFKLTWFKDKGSETIPRESKKLVKDLGFRGSTVVNFIWGDDARESVRKVATLKAQYVEKARDVTVPQVFTVPGEDKAAVVDKDKAPAAPKKKGGVNLSKWVKGLSKK